MAARSGYSIAASEAGERGQVTFYPIEDKNARARLAASSAS